MAVSCLTATRRSATRLQHRHFLSAFLSAAGLLRRGRCCGHRISFGDPSSGSTAIHLGGLHAFSRRILSAAGEGMPAAAALAGLAAGVVAGTAATAGAALGSAFGLAAGLLRTNRWNKRPFRPERSRLPLPGSDLTGASAFSVRVALSESISLISRPSRHSRHPFQPAGDLNFRYRFAGARHFHFYNSHDYSE